MKKPPPGKLYGLRALLPPALLLFYVAVAERLGFIITAGLIVETKNGGGPKELIFVGPDTIVSDALALMDKNGVTPLHHAVRFRSPVAVETLLRLGAAVNQPCKRSGSTPLHRAVTSTGAPSTAGKQARAREIIKMLLRYGADPSIKNKLGKKPADYVRDEDLRRLLKKNPAK